VIKLACKPALVVPGDKEFSVARAAVAASAVSVDSEYHIPEFTPISNQGSLGSCVANATCDALEILLGVEDPNGVVQLSRLLAYWNSRSYTNDTAIDDGTYIRNCVDSLQRLGVAPEDAWPYDPRQVFAQPPIRAYQLSLDNKIATYYSVQADRANSVEAAVRANHPVVFASDVSQEYTQHFNRGDGVWDTPRTWIGSHAQIVVGVRSVGGQRQFRVRNSWGPTFGDNGHSWYTEAYIESARCNDFWVMTRVPTLVF
jgi:C1A family cysteine protease